MFGAKRRTGFLAGIPWRSIKICTSSKRSARLVYPSSDCWVGLSSDSSWEINKTRVMLRFDCDSKTASALFASSTETQLLSSLGALSFLRIYSRLERSYSAPSKRERFFFALSVLVYRAQASEWE